MLREADVDRIVNAVMAKLQAKLSIEGIVQRRLPDGTTEGAVKITPPYTDLDKQLLELMKVLPSVDLAAQLDSYLLEGGRKKGTDGQIKGTVLGYLSWWNETGNAPDGKQAATGWKDVLKQKGLTPRTINFHLSRLKAFMQHALDHGWVSANPFGGIKIKTKGKHSATVRVREQYTPEEVQAIIKRLRADIDPRHWLIAILIWTGMRLGEVAQLFCADVREVNGVWCFDIHQRRPGMSIKNESSERLVPVHSALLRLGLLEFVEWRRTHGFERVFDWGLGSKPGGYAGGYARRFLKGEVHRLRHSFMTQLLQAGVQEVFINSLVGHSPFRSELATYAHLDDMRIMQAEIEKLTY